MKIEFEIDLNDFQKALIEHIEIEAGTNIHEVMKDYCEGHLMEMFAERKKAIADILTRSNAIDDAILKESRLVAKARAPIW